MNTYISGNYETLLSLFHDLSCETEDIEQFMTH